VPPGDRDRLGTARRNHRSPDAGHGLPALRRPREGGRQHHDAPAAVARGTIRTNREGSQHPAAARARAPAEPHPGTGAAQDRQRYLHRRDHAGWRPGAALPQPHRGHFPILVRADPLETRTRLERRFG
jgi:hypothetical protein